MQTFLQSRCSVVPTSPVFVSSLGKSWIGILLTLGKKIWEWFSIHVLFLHLALYQLCLWYGRATQRRTSSGNSACLLCCFSVQKLHMQQKAKTSQITSGEVNSSHAFWESSKQKGCPSTAVSSMILKTTWSSWKRKTAICNCCFGCFLKNTVFAKFPWWLWWTMVTYWHPESNSSLQAVWEAEQLVPQPPQPTQHANGKEMIVQFSCLTWTCPQTVVSCHHRFCFFLFLSHLMCFSSFSLCEYLYSLLQSLLWYDNFQYIRIWQFACQTQWVWILI